MWQRGFQYWRSWRSHAGRPKHWAHRSHFLVVWYQAVLPIFLRSTSLAPMQIGLHESIWADKKHNGSLTRYVNLRVMHRECRERLPCHRLQTKPSVSDHGITARASRTSRDVCRNRKPAVARKMFPAFPAHAQPTSLCIWQEAHETN